MIDPSAFPAKLTARQQQILDLIQSAIRRVLEGRTTLLITHRLSQIRWADKVLMLRRGKVIDFGTHDELVARCDLYQRIFAHYGEVRSAEAVEM